MKFVLSFERVIIPGAEVYFIQSKDRKKKKRLREESLENYDPICPSSMLRTYVRTCLGERKREIRDQSELERERDRGREDLFPSDPWLTQSIG